MKQKNEIQEVQEKVIMKSGRMKFKRKSADYEKQKYLLNFKRKSANYEKLRNKKWPMSVRSYRDRSLIL